LQRRPLARITQPVIVARGGELVLSATAYFWGIENLCNENGCVTTVSAQPEPLCVSLKAPFGATSCPSTDVSFTELEEVSPDVDTFFGHFDRTLSPASGLALPDASYFGVRANGLVAAEGELLDDVPDGARFDLHLSLVRTAAGDTIDIAPEG